MLTLLYKSCEVNTQEQTQMIISLTLKSLRRQFKQRQKFVQTLLGSLDQQYRPCKMAPLSLRYYFTRPKSKTNWSASKWPRTTFRVVSRKFPRMSAAAASEHWWRQTQVWFENNNTKDRCSMFIKTHQIIFSPPFI